MPEPSLTIKEQLAQYQSEQQRILEITKLNQESKPRFTALQNIEKLFKDKPVVSNEKHRIRLEDIANWNVQEEEKQDPGFLVKQLMACINPFASYVVTECRDKNESM